MDKKDFYPLKKAFQWNKFLNNEKIEEYFNDDLLLINIKAVNKGDFWLYNYTDEVLMSRNHPVLMFCRGLVVNTQGLIQNFPFKRFFNDFEEDLKDEIDWKTAKILEKVDGSLICVWWDGKDWEITTRGSFYPQELSNINYKQLFKSMFKNFDKAFEKLSFHFCYMFELCTKKNRIITWYDTEDVYLLGARSLVSFKEVSQDILDDIAKKINVKRPRMFSANNIEQCKKLFENFKDDEEGLVVVDDKFNRIKLKQESYIKLHKIKMLKPQELFEYMLGLIELDSEYLEKCPEVIDELNKIKSYYNNLLKIVDTKFDEIKQESDNKKEFALEAIKYKYSGMLFAKYTGKNIVPRLRWEKVKDLLN